MIQTVAEMVIGAIYAIGATFNIAYTLRHSREFFGEFAERAWFAPTARVTARLIVPNSVAFTIVLIVFQVAVATAILTQGNAVATALVVGGCFAASVAMLSSPGGTVGNLLLAAIQFALAGTH